MEYVVALKRGISPESLRLSEVLDRVPGVQVRGANPQRAQVTVESEQALAALRDAVGTKCHIEPVSPRRTS